MEPALQNVKLQDMTFVLQDAMQRLIVLQHGLAASVIMDILAVMEIFSKSVNAKTIFMINH
jgi:hypothetical protein